MTEGEEVERKEKLKSKWAQLEAVVGSEKRIKLIARDLVDHFESAARRHGRQGHGGDDEPTHRGGTLSAKSRCCDLNGDSDDDDSWCDESRDDWLGVRSAGLADAHPQQAPPRGNWRSGSAMPNDPFKIVIVRDMWLTGFDAPSLQTMYVDKPMRGHGLMQAIARVNRVFKDKPGGLVVDYLGLADELKQALATYTESRRQRKNSASIRPRLSP